MKRSVVLITSFCYLKELPSPVSVTVLNDVPNYFHENTSVGNTVTLFSDNTLYDIVVFTFRRAASGILSPNCWDSYRSLLGHERSWRHHGPPKRWYSITTPRGVITQKTMTWIFTAVKSRSTIERRNTVVIIKVSISGSPVFYSRQIAKF
jgi:hypothetical protein